MKYLINLLLITLTCSCFAQKEVSVASINGVINELLHQITIEKGETIDTAAVRNLFHPTAQLTVLMNGDSTIIESISLNDFLILLKDPYYEEGYSEKEITKTINEYNGIAQVFQSFYGKDSEGIEERGMNSYQLAHYHDRWWIVSI